jgi:hypothetical protein
MSKRYLEIYSGRRNRNQYPSPSNFDIPFGTSSEIKDPILNGSIYYQWGGSPLYPPSGITNFPLYDYGTIISATNTGTVILKSDVTPSTTVDAYKGLTLFINPVAGQGNFQIQTILTYNPSTSTVTVQTGFLTNPIGSTYFIYANYLYSSYTNKGLLPSQIPYQDYFGNKILDQEQAYINYYLMNESVSYGSSIVASKIIYYDYNIRTAYIPPPIFYNSFDYFTLRKSLPEEIWDLETPTYINTDLTEGPLGPVITLPAGAVPVDEYYVGKYVYFVSNGPTSNVESNFKPIYGVFYIKAYKAISMDVNKLFVNYDQNDSLLPNYLVNQGTILEHETNFLQLSNFTVQTPNGSSYVGYTIVNTTSNETSFIKSVGYSENGDYGIFIDPSNPFTLSNIGDPYTITSSKRINIVSLQGDNAASLDYIGTMVSVNQAICYDIELIELILPNIPLQNGTIISTYPFVYVQLKNVSSPIGVSPSTIYSNNPPSTYALFVVLITDITDPTTSAFVKLRCSTVVRVKFKPNDSFHFSVTLPDGTYVTPAMPDYFSPYAPNPALQIHATFGIKPI